MTDSPRPIPASVGKGGMGEVYRASSALQAICKIGSNMRTHTNSIIGVLLLLTVSMAFAQQPAPVAKPTSPDDQYLPGPEWQRQPGVPKGKVFQLTFGHSQAFPGTTRTT